MRIILTVLILNIASQAAAQNFYCEGELGFEIEKKENQRDPNRTVYAPPRPKNNVGAKAEFNKLSFGFTIYDGSVKLHIPYWFSGEVSLEQVGELFKTDIYSSSEVSMFFIDAFQFKQKKSKIGGNLSGFYHKLFIDRIKNTVFFLEQEWDRSHDPHVYETFAVTSSSCVEITD
jgi:hypothetical protein